MRIKKVNEDDEQLIDCRMRKLTTTNGHLSLSLYLTI